MINPRGKHNGDTGQSHQPGTVFRLGSGTSDKCWNSSNRHLRPLFILMAEVDETQQPRQSENERGHSVMGIVGVDEAAKGDEGTCRRHGKKCFGWQFEQIGGPASRTAPRQ